MGRGISSFRWRTGGGPDERGEPPDDGPSEKEIEQKNGELVVMVAVSRRERGYEIDETTNHTEDDNANEFCLTKLSKHVEATLWIVA